MQKSASDETQKRPHLVIWKNCRKLKNEGGLGIRDLTLLNHALIVKWNWRFAHEENDLWNAVIIMKFGVKRTDHQNGENQPWGGAIWKSIEEGWEDTHKNIEYEVGNGKKTKFLTDLWCSTRSLAERLETLYRLTHEKCNGGRPAQATAEGLISWNLCFLRGFNGWVVEEVDNGCTSYSKAKKWRCWWMIEWDGSTQKMGNSQLYLLWN